MQNLIKDYFTESIQTQIVSADALPEKIEQAGGKLVEALLNGNKILVCGNGASAANAQSFTTKLIDCVDIERPSIPVIALVCDNVVMSAIADNGLYTEVYAKQIQALGQQGDVLIVLSPLGNSPGITRAIVEAAVKGMSIIALTGGEGGKLTELLSSQDLEIRIPSNKKVRIEEMHLLVLNCFCELIERALFAFQE